MRLHDLKPHHKRQSRQRLGRGNGSTRGHTAGRGDKGAKARAGYRHRPHFEGGQISFMRRLPKRGFNNPNHVEYTVVNVARLEDTYDSGAQVDSDSLRRQGLVGKEADAIKILGDGELTKTLHVQANKFSRTARTKIESAGGTCETV